MPLEVADSTRPTTFDDPSLATPLAEVVRAAPRLQYIHSYSFFFEHPYWVSNLALATVAFLVPVVGQIVMAGYQVELIESLHRWPKKPYPQFEFNRFGEYLSRGIWKFLVDMLSQFVMMPVYFFLYIVSVFAIIGVGIAFSPNQQNPGPAMGIAAAIVVPLALAIVFLLSGVLQIITTPLVLKASLSGEANALFDLRFLREFLHRTWRETLLEMVWMGVTTPVMTVLGLALCIVGIYPALALVQMADAHTTWQLYEIYLARGGEPIRIKILKPAPVIAVPIEEPAPYVATTVSSPDHEGGASPSLT
jgi:hypothetical protein